MLFTVVQDIYGPAGVGDVANSLKQLLSGSHDWSETGVYCYWDPDTREAL